MFNTQKVPKFSIAIIFIAIIMFVFISINYLSNNSHINYIYADIELNHKYMGKQIVRPSDENGKTPFPHPSLIVERSIFNEVDFFDLTLKIAMDYDFMCRLIKEKYRGFYYKKVVVLMDGKGISSNGGLEAVNERILVLRRYDMHDFYSYYYQDMIISILHLYSLAKMKF